MTATAASLAKESRLVRFIMNIIFIMFITLSVCCPVPLCLPCPALPCSKLPTHFWKRFSYLLAKRFQVNAINKISTAPPGMFSRMKSDSKPLAPPSPAWPALACIRSCLFILARAAFCLSCLFCLSSLAKALSLSLSCCSCRVSVPCCCPFLSACPCLCFLLENL